MRSKSKSSKSEKIWLNLLKNPDSICLVFQ